MSRELTQQERQLLLDNPQLVMFNPSKGVTVFLKHPILLAFLPFAIFAVVIPVLVFTFEDFFLAHDVLFSVVLCVGMLFTVIMIPVVFCLRDKRVWEKEHSDCYRIPLKRVLPVRLTGCVVTITKVDFMNQQDIQYALLTAEEDGVEKKYNYFGFVNRFELIEGQELLVVADGEFFAFVQQATLTDGLYNSCK